MRRVERGLRHVGVFGTAEHVAVPDHPSAAVNVSTWFMHLPGQAPAGAWDKYQLAVASLEDMPGMPAPRLHYPEAEFELLVVALAPDLHPRVDDADTWMPMSPANVVEQFHGVTRAQVERMAQTLAWACVNGRLLTETQVIVQPADGSEMKVAVIAPAVELWRSTVAQLVEHERTGGLHGARLN